MNKDDGGTIECFVLFIRAKPKTLKMYDDEEFEVIKIRVEVLRTKLSNERSLLNLR